MKLAVAYAKDHRPHFVADLAQFIRFPTISAQTQNAEALRQCALWLAEHLKKIGLDKVSVQSTKGQPLVYAEWLRLPGRPTVLIYGHYDVQPIDPLDEWHTPPFEPVIRGDDLFGRGASDDKGQLFCHVKAMEAYLHSSGSLPVNVKCIFDGEEEIGSPNLEAFLKRNRSELAADVAVASDMPILGKQQPALTYSMRGALAMELELRGPRVDLHAGLFGGSVHNPIQALCEMLASLHDRERRVAISGFYERVQNISSAERIYLAKTGPTDEEIRATTGANGVWGEVNYTAYERTTVRPALTINGITGGYQGVGSKAVIPSRAATKLSFRLVPHQDPAEIERLFRSHIAKVTPATVKSVIKTNFKAHPVWIDPRNSFLRIATGAYAKAFGAAPVFVRSGGTIPALSTFQDVLKLPMVLMGFGLPDDRIHAPNEKFHLPNFYKGIETSIHFADLSHAT